MSSQRGRGQGPTGDSEWTGQPDWSEARGRTGESEWTGQPDWSEARGRTGESEWTGQSDWPDSHGRADGLGQTDGPGQTGDRGWPDGQDWPEDSSPARGARSRILLSVLAAVLVAVALGAYGLVRDHGSTVSALQDSATAPCPATTSTGGTGGGGTGGGGTGGGSGGCRSAAAGAAGTGSSGSGPTASPRSSAKSRRAHKSRARRSTPTPGASTHAANPAPPTPKPSPVRSTTAPTGTSSSSAAGQVLALINQARAQAGLPAYTVSSGLDTSSRKHTMVMAGGCGLSHQCPGEAALGDRLTAAGVQWTSAGENIGEGGPEPDSTADIAQMAVGLTQDMLNEKPPDDGHRLNILSSSFHHTGIYVYRDSSGTVWMTQDFSS